ncbi:MAG: hypothetical protein LBH32_10405, partial [Dysgonamonadaceae bacterium]|nr:hypothetical protein [Dysgonamonadaceae bacterium]
EKAGLQALELMQSWEAGSHNNKNVNVILTQVIHLEYRLIQLNSIMTIKVNTVFQTDTNPN